MKRQDIDLVHVIWGEDQGVVSLKHNAIVFYAFGDFDGHHSLVPTVEIEDADFALIMEPYPDDPEVFEATWDDVTRLLNDPRFPLMERAKFPEE